MKDAYVIVEKILKDETVLENEGRFTEIYEEYMEAEQRLPSYIKDEAQLDYINEDGRKVFVGNIEYWLGMLSLGFDRKDPIDLFEQVRDYLKAAPFGVHWILAYALYHMTNRAQGSLMYFQGGYKELMAYVTALQFETDHQPYGPVLMAHAMEDPPSLGKLYILQKFAAPLFPVQLIETLESDYMSSFRGQGHEFESLLKKLDAKFLKKLARRFKPDTLNVNKNEAYRIIQCVHKGESPWGM